MKDDKIKWAYTFTLLLLTLAWAYVSIVAVMEALVLPDPVNVLEASGATLLLGALITWNGNVNQYWFRKKGPNSNAST